MCGALVAIKHGTIMIQTTKISDIQHIIDGIEMPRTFVNISLETPQIISEGKQEHIIPQHAGGLFDPVEVQPHCQPQKRRRVIDFTLINSELHHLELRLNELWNVVDVFFISESAVSFKAIPISKKHTPEPKPLHLTNHWNDFKRFHSKMVLHVITPEISQTPRSSEKSLSHFTIEGRQRDAQWDALKERLNPQPDDLIIISDLDEFPRPEVIEKLACEPHNSLPKTPICLHANFFYYNFKCHNRNPWNHRPRVQHYQDGGHGPLQSCKSKIVNASSHCSSCFGSLDYYHTKMLSNADPIEDDPLMFNNASILDRIRNCKDVYLRKDQHNKLQLRSHVDYGSIPVIVSKHPERWPYMMGTGPLYEGADSN